MEMGQVCIFTACEIEPDLMGLGVKIVTTLDTEVTQVDPSSLVLGNTFTNFSLPTE